MHDRLRNAANQQPLETCVSVRAEDDQISLPLFGFVNDH